MLKGTDKYVVPYKRVTHQRHLDLWVDVVPKGRHCNREGMIPGFNKLTMLDREDLEHIHPVGSDGLSINNQREPVPQAV